MRGVALGDTGDEVGDQGAGQPVQRAALPLVVGAGDHDGAVLGTGDRDGLGDCQRQGALGPLDRDVLALDADIDTSGNQDRLLTNTRHGSSSFPLPDVREDFAADARTGRLAVGEQTRGRGDDRHAEATQHAGQIGGLCVDPETGLAETRRRPAMLRSRLGPYLSDDQRLAHAGIFGAVVVDVALALEDLGDVRLDLRVRQSHLVVIRRVGVTQTRQEVCDWIRHCHDSGVTFLAAVPCTSCAGLLRTFNGLGSGVRLPAGLLDAGQFAGMCHLAKADAAEPELAVHRVRTATPVAAGVAANLELGLLVGLVDQCLLCHLLSSP